MALLLSVMTLVVFTSAGYAQEFDVPEGNTGIVTWADPYVEQQNKELLAKKLKDLEEMDQYPSARRVYSVNMPVYSQETYYYCGPASAQMLLKAAGFDVISTSKDLDKKVLHGSNKQTITSPQVTIASKMSVPPTAAEMAMALNKFMTGDQDYRPLLEKWCRDNVIDEDFYVADKCTSKNLIGPRIKRSLGEGYGTGILVNAYKLKRYANNTAFGGHFVCIDYYADTSELVGIKDCNYDKRYGGSYTEDLDTVVAAMASVSGPTNIIW